MDELILDQIGVLHTTIVFYGIAGFFNVYFFL